MTRKYKVLMAKPGLDGHDVGAKVVVRALRDAGLDVVYSGLRQTPEAIAAAARDQDVDVIGLSILSGSHLPLCKQIKEYLVEYGIDNKMWLVGGNVPKRDHAALKDLGVDAIFPTGSNLDEIANFIRENIARWPRN